MLLLRRSALVVLWLLAALGIACGGVWAATQVGVIKPLVVISGSMEPEIATGDLLIAVPAPVEDLAVGDVVSLPSQLSDAIVTHRIQEIAPAADGFLVTMKGDANPVEDALDYPVSGSVWKPALQLPGWGNAILQLATPTVAVPLLCGLLGLVGLAFLLPADETPRRTHRGARAGGI